MVRFFGSSWLAIGLLLMASGLSAGEQTPQLINGWGQTEDPDGDCKISAKEGSVTISIPGTAHDLWPGDGRKVNAPRVLQDVEGDFTVQVRVASSVKPENGFFRAGTLLIWLDDKTFIRLDSACAHRGGATFDFYCYLHVFKDTQRLVNEQLRPLKDQPTDLRLERRGNRIVASFSQDGARTWKAFGEKTVDLPRKVKVGVAAVQGTNSPFSVTLEDLKISK
jgi:regulation of enolase protein 1 (concanavalin A-like superfamily)